MKPELGIVQEMERHIGHLFVVRSPANAKVVFTAINPWQGIARTIEVELVVCREEITLL
jgi:hypothetical protein